MNFVSCFALVLDEEKWFVGVTSIGWKKKAKLRYFDGKFLNFFKNVENSRSRFLVFEERWDPKIPISQPQKERSISPTIPNQKTSSQLTRIVRKKSEKWSLEWIKFKIVSLTISNRFKINFHKLCAQSAQAHLFSMIQRMMTGKLAGDFLELIRRDWREIFRNHFHLFFCLIDEIFWNFLEKSFWFFLIFSA